MPDCDTWGFQVVLKDATNTFFPGGDPMKAMSNVIAFQTGRRLPSDMLGDVLPETLSKAEEVGLIMRAQNLLKEMEASWELDHQAPEMRDKFCLLRGYLRRLEQGSYPG